MLLIDALVGWLVSLAGESVLRRIKESPDDRALREALTLAIDQVMSRTHPGSHDAIKSALTLCFARPPLISASMEDSLIEATLASAVSAQAAPLVALVQNNASGESFHVVTGVEPDWFIDAIAKAFISSLRQVVALSGVAELVHRLDADQLHADIQAIDAKLETLATRNSAVPYMSSLPNDTAIFTGRHAELAEVMRIATAESASRIVAIDGMAGAGKTAFAIHAARRIEHLFPDGQLFVSLHAYTPEQPTARPEDVLTTLLRATGLDGRQIPSDIDAMEAMWRSRLRGKRVLLLLDDAMGPEQVRPLIPGTGSCFTLITSRRRFTSFQDAFALTLGTLQPIEARTLLRRAAQRIDVGSDSEADQLVRQCGYLPLAIGIVAGLLRHHPSWSIGDVLDDLTLARGRLIRIRAEKISVAAALDVSFARLPTDQQRLFMLLGLHVSSDIDIYAAAALVDTSPADASASLVGLYDDNMIDEPHRNRFRLHDLAREYATSLAESIDQNSRTLIFSRLIDYYGQAASAASRWISRRGVRRGYTIGDLSFHIPGLLAKEGATNWLEAELPNIQLCVMKAQSMNRPLSGAQLADVIAEFLLTTGHWMRALAIHQAAVEAARDVANQWALATALNNLGAVQRLIENYPNADDSLSEGLAIFGKFRDDPREAETLHNLAIVKRFRGQYIAARACHQRALVLFHSLGDGLGEAESFENLGILELVTADYEAATKGLTAALNLFIELRDRLGEADAHHNLAVVYRLTGDYDEAIASHRRALDIYDALGYRYGQAFGRAEYAIVLRFTGDTDQAAVHLRRARALFRDLGDQVGEADVINSLGTISQLSGDYLSATERHQQALTMYEDLDYQYGRAYALASLGTAQAGLGDYGLARSCLRRAIDLCRALDDHHGEASALTKLGDVERLDGDGESALSSYEAALDIARRIGAPLEEARALEGCGACLIQENSLLTGVNYLQAALVIYQRLKISDAGRVRTAIDASSGEGSGA
jgi:tetratricopeptide (TPR) repeat protein